MDLSYTIKDSINVSSPYRGNKTVTLCKPHSKRFVELNGIDLESVNFVHKLNDISEIDFNVYKYIDIDGEIRISSGYEELHAYMEVFIDGIGCFQLEEPEISDDGDLEIKKVHGNGVSQELIDKDLVGIKINKGTKDSCEYLADDNIDDEGYAINYVEFYNEDNKQLSLLDIVIEKVPTWSIGYVSQLLKSKRGSFSIDSQSIFAFLTGEVASTFKCVFDFDIINRVINVYDIDDVGYDTNITIGFRNLLKNVSITSTNADSVRTRFNVSGGDSLSISQVNLGDTRIEDLSYFMTTDYVSQDIIDKYNNWSTKHEEFRQLYIDETKNNNKINADLYLLKYRVPSDKDYYEQWDEMELEELNLNLKHFNEELTTLRLLVDDNPQYDADNNYIPWTKSDGSVNDEEYMQRLKSTDQGYYTYKEIITYIIPNIQTAIDNYNELDDNKKDYNDNYEYDWVTKLLQQI